MDTFNISNLISYNSTNDISYIQYNRTEIPYRFDTTYIHHSNKNYNDGSYSDQLGPINNNLVIESNDSNIVLSVSENKKVIVENSMAVNKNLDVSNVLTTNKINTNDISSGGVLYLNSDIGTNIIGDLRINGNLVFANSLVQQVLESSFSIIETSTIRDSAISNSDIISSDFSNATITSSYITNSVIGYDRNNNSAPAGAIFNDVSLTSLTLNSKIQDQVQTETSIKFNNNTNTDYISIKNSNDYSKLEINKPLVVGPRIINTNITNISIFNGDISCNTLHYSYLNPDIRLNNYFDVSIGEISLSGSIIPTRPSHFDLGSSTSKFRNIYSDKFTGVLDGSSTIALDLVPNLNMTFNDLTITGIFTLSGQNLNQNLSTNFVTISNVNISFRAITRDISDICSNVITTISGLRFDISKSISDISLSIKTINDKITDISNNTYRRGYIDNSLNFNYVKVNNTIADFKIFDKFIFTNTGTYTQNTATAYNSTTIAEWRTNYLNTNTSVIQFMANGTITNRTGVYSGFSDIRLKENIVNTTPKLVDLLKVRVVNYNLKGTINNNENKHIGVLAQELEEIFPSLVSEVEPSIEDIKAGKTEKYKTVKYSCFSVILIKALQEEHEIINKLQSRIVTLNEEYNIYKDLQETTQVLKNDITSLKQENTLLKSKLNEILTKLEKSNIDC